MKICVITILVDTNNEIFLKYTATLAKKYNLEIHGWVWILNANNDQDVQENHPDWFAKNKLGESSLTKPAYVDYYKWLCPSKKEVQIYLQNKITKMLEKYDLDGIHLDYIRYPDVILPKNLQPKYNLIQDKEMPQFDYCYCETCQKNFETKFGYNPLNIMKAKEQKNWNEYRFEQLTNLVNSISKTVKSFDKQISAAVFPTVEMSKKMVRQDWSKWNIDKFFPMVYNDFYGKNIEWFDEVIKENLKYVDKEKIVPGIYTNKISGKQFVRVQKIIKKYDLPGFSMFDYHSTSKLLFDLFI